MSPHLPRCKFKFLVSIFDHTRQNNIITSILYHAKVKYNYKIFVFKFCFRFLDFRFFVFIFSACSTLTPRPLRCSSAAYLLLICCDLLLICGCVLLICACLLLIWNSSSICYLSLTCCCPLLICCYVLLICCVSEALLLLIFCHVLLICAYLLRLMLIYRLSVAYSPVDRKPTSFYASMTVYLVASLCPLFPSIA